MSRQTQLALAAHLIQEAQALLTEPTDAKEVERIKVGPKPLTIAEYLRRNTVRATEQTPSPPNPKIRAGKRVQLKKHLVELYRLANIPGQPSDVRQKYLHQAKQVKGAIRSSKAAKRKQRKTEEQEFHTLFSNIVETARRVDKDKI